MKRKLMTIGLITLLVVATCSGWVFNVVKSRSNARANEFAALQSTFNQQYGTDGVTIKQLVSPKKVYVAVWTSKDGASHVSWNIGGLWVTVFSSEIPTTP